MMEQMSCSFKVMTLVVTEESSRMSRAAWSARSFPEIPVWLKIQFNVTFLACSCTLCPLTGMELMRCMLSVLCSCLRHCMVPRESTCMITCLFRNFACFTAFPIATRSVCNAEEWSGRRKWHASCMCTKAAAALCVSGLTYPALIYASAFSSFTATSGCWACRVRAAMVKPTFLFVNVVAEKQRVGSCHWGLCL